MMSLTDVLPLRHSTVWNGFREARPIPHRYGFAVGEPIQYDEGRRLWVWADHACEGVDEVLVGGQPYGAWQFSNAEDSTGHAIALVELDAPLDEGAVITVRGRGKLHPHHGGRMRNAAEVVWDVLANIAGLPIAESALDEFRAAVADLPVDGSVLGEAPGYDEVRQVCASVGAVFAPDGRGLASVWPGGPPVVPRGAILPHHELVPECTRSVVNELTARFDWTAGQPRAAILFEAPDSIARFGRRPAQLDLLWITEARAADLVARRYLAQSARPVWVVTASGLRGDVRPCDVVTLDHPVLPLGGRHMVLERDAALDEDRNTVVVRVPVGDVPRVDLVRQSRAFEPQAYSSVQISTQGAERIVTVTDTDGITPLANAAVTLDGTVTRYTDSAGRVAFPVSAMPTGQHTLLIRTADGRSLQTTVVVQ